MSKKEKVLWILNKAFMSYFVIVFIFINVAIVDLLNYCLSHTADLAREPEGLFLPAAYDIFVLIHTVVFIVAKVFLKRKIDVVLFLPVITFLTSLVFIFHYHLGFSLTDMFQINLIGRSLLSLLSLIALFFILKKRQSPVLN